MLLHSHSPPGGWPPAQGTTTSTSGSCGCQLTLPSLRAASIRRSPGSGQTPAPAEGVRAPAALWRRRDSDVSESQFVTPLSSPPAARPMTQVRLLMRMAPAAASPALSLALGSRCAPATPASAQTAISASASTSTFTAPSTGHTATSTSTSTGHTAISTAVSTTIATAAARQNREHDGEDDAEREAGEATRLLAAPSCDSLDETFFDATS